MRRKTLLILGLMSLTFWGGQQVQAMLLPDNKETDDASANSKFSETDTYVDLNTGKTFKFIYDGLNDIYNRSDLLGLDLYVNTNTRDTFWLEDGIVVNNALIRDEAGKYKIDPMKVKRDGNTFKVKLSARQ